MGDVQDGDAVIVKETRIAEGGDRLVRTWFELIVLPETATRKYRILDAAVKQGYAIAEQCGVRLWYTEDGERYVPVVRPRREATA